MKTLDEIDDEYKVAFDEEIEKYKTKLAAGKNKKKVKEEFSRNLNKLISRRNRLSKKYIDNNHEKLLGMPEKKKKKEIERGVYRAHHIDFRRTFWVRTKMILGFFWFKMRMISRTLYYNIIPSKIKFLFFRMGIFLSSIWFDVKMAFAFVVRDVRRIFGRHSERAKEVFLKFYNKNKAIVDSWVEKYKAWQEERKKKKEELEQKKQEEEEEKKKKEEEAKKQKEEGAEEKPKEGEEGSVEEKKEESREEDVEKEAPKESPEVEKKKEVETEAK